MKSVQRFDRRRRAVCFPVLLTDDELLEVAGGVDVEELEESFTGSRVHDYHEYADQHAHDPCTATAASAVNLSRTLTVAINCVIL